MTATATEPLTSADALRVLHEACPLADTSELSTSELVEAALAMTHPLRNDGDDAAHREVIEAARCFAAHDFADEHETAEDLLGSRWLTYYIEDRLAAADVLDLDALMVLAAGPDADQA